MITAINLVLLLFAADANATPIIPATISATFINYEDSQLTAGRRAYAVGEYQQAVTILKDYVGKKPKSYDGHFYLGLSYRCLKQFDDAIASLEKAAQIKPLSAQVQYELGLAYLDGKKYDAAVKQYQWLEKENKRLGLEFRLFFPTEVAKQYQLPPSLLEQWKAELDLAQPILPLSSQLHPRITYKDKATYTEEARNNKVQGTVVLNIVFSREGKVIVVEVVRGLPYGLTQTSIEAARKIRFTPATKDGQPVSVRGNIEFSFALY